MDAGELSQDAGSPDRPARPFGNRRPAARGQLDHPRAHAGAQGDLAGQGSGRGGPRPVSLFRGGDAGRQPRRATGEAAQRQYEIFVDLQLSDPELGRHRRGGLVGRRRRDHESGAIAEDVLWPVQPGDGAHLQGREFSPAPGLRHHDEDVVRHEGAEGDGAGCVEPLLVSVADDVRPVGQGLRPLRAVDGLEDQD